VKYGVGRQSISGITATCFGATGFVGRYVVAKLGKCGSNCIIPYRGTGLNTRHLKLMGDLGKVVPLPVDFREEESLRQTVLRSNVVINMLGTAYETNNYSYDDVNVKCVHRLCTAAAESGTVKRFIHFSALGADLKSPSALLRSKAVGESVVRDYFPHATILRPAPIFGDEDRFLNVMAAYVAGSIVVPELANGEQKVQPIYVQDVAQAAVSACVDPDAPGRIYELGGPDVLTRREILQWVVKNLDREDEAVVLPMPKVLCKGLATVLKYSWKRDWKHITPDMVDQFEIPFVVNPAALKLEDLGVESGSLDEYGHYPLLFYRGSKDIKIHVLPKGDPRVTWLARTPDGVPTNIPEC